MNKTIYTCIIGKGYKLREPKTPCPGWDYYCITDQDIESDLYTIVSMETSDKMKSDKRRNSRLMKINCPFNGVSIYIDAKFRPIDNLDWFVDKYLGENDIALMEHNKRSCVFKEATYCKRNGIESGNNLQLQIFKYIEEGLPKDYGLWAPGIMIRRSGETVRKFNDLWWNEYLYGNTDRDMFSLAYSVWKSPQLKIGLMPFRNTYDRWRK